MKQFDVLKNTNPITNQQIPYLLNIQNDILHNLSTIVVVPLIKDIQPISNLNPTFPINNEIVVMSTAELASVSKSLLGEKICSLSDKRTEIISALDFMITGF
jgi:toxin CcdB